MIVYNLRKNAENIGKEVLKAAEALRHSRDVALASKLALSYMYLSNVETGVTQNQVEMIE